MFYSPPNMPLDATKEARIGPQGQALPRVLGVKGQQQRAQMSAKAAAVTSAQTPQQSIATASYSFVLINAPNSTYVQPNAINDAGLVAGFYYDPSYNSHGFIWQNGSLQTIDYPNALDTSLTGINDHGIVSGIYTDASYNTYAVTYSISNAVWTTLPAILVPDLPGVWPWSAEYYYPGINNAGDMIGCSLDNSQRLSWIWNSGSQSYSYFTIPGAAEAATCVQAFNDEGHSVGVFTAANGSAQQPFGSSLSFLKTSDDHYETIEAQQILSGSVFFPPFGVNDRDAFVGTVFNSTTSVGFIRTCDGAVKLVNDPAYLNETSVTGINDHDVLVGDGYDPTTGEQTGFIAYPQ